MSESTVQLRLIPYPYRAMLAICSDLDETPDRHVYRQIMRFLNTAQTTPMGEGLDLEVGNTIYFDMSPDQFAYWNTDDAGRAMLRTLIRSGHIDCLHSFGDLATTRAHAARALDELCRHDCRLQVWIDHATAPTNFGADIMQGHGDEPGHPACHADLTIDYGIRYVWRGRITSVTGQNVPPRWGGLLTPAHPLASARTLAKETAKHLLARLGNIRYAMHGPNRLLRPTTLRTGAPVCEFLRCNPHWGGVSSCDTGRQIGSVLTQPVLDQLQRRSGVCVLYTHLGKIHRYDTPFDPSAVAGLRRLAHAHHAGRILVTTTRRLLNYCSLIDHLRFRASHQRTHITIDLALPPSASLSQGLTFCLPDSRPATITVNGTPLPDVRTNPPDHLGQRTISLPWPRLEFPDL